ncbi:MAG: DUF420 domain-containing protein, partial [Opitutae bacterium]
FRDKEANPELAKKLNLMVWIISAAVLGLVVMMQKIKIPLPEGADLSNLPGFHALLNSMAAVFLVLAIRAIKNGKVTLHQKMIYAAFICSLVFLLSYVTYHITTPATLFGDANKDGLLSSAEREAVSGTRPYYLFILISHIGLAALSFPFILRTFVHAFTNQFENHRKLSKKVFPVWLYVAVTGPIVYFFLQPYY